MEKTKHFVLIHGICHGAWSWYKIIPMIKAAGHRVTALDLGGCGINPKKWDEISSVFEYVQPLMEFMASLGEEEQESDDEKVILVGHSYGGIGISLAMEAYPNKILAAVYISGFMPNSRFPPADLVLEFFKRTPMETLMDTKFGFEEGENLPTSASFGPKCMAANLYQNCQPEDIELGSLLAKPSGCFLKDLSKEALLTEQKFGSVKRIFIGCESDKLLTKDLQLWFVENSPPHNVTFIQGGDHMVMLSKPNELFHSLMEIATSFI